MIRRAEKYSARFFFCGRASHAEIEMRLKKNKGKKGAYFTDIIMIFLYFF